MYYYYYYYYALEHANKRRKGGGGGVGVQHRHTKPKRLSYFRSCSSPIDIWWQLVLSLFSKVSESVIKLRANDEQTQPMHRQPWITKTRPLQEVNTLIYTVLILKPYMELPDLESMCTCELSSLLFLFV